MAIDERLQELIGYFLRAYIVQREQLERQAAWLKQLQVRRNLDTTRAIIIDRDGPEYEATLDNVISKD